MINRKQYYKIILKSLKRSPVTAILGPRQSGKSTMAKQILKKMGGTIFDLEDFRDKSRLENPILTFSNLKGLIVIDEIQLMPDLFSLLRVLVDQKPLKRRFLILGSASPTIIKGASESLAGRIEFISLGVFNLNEVGEKFWNKCWLRGGFPRSFLSKSTDDSFMWRNNFTQTFLERDIPVMGLNLPPLTLRRFWTMIAHSHGQIWNASELGRSLGKSDKTVRSYLELLAGTYMVRILPPWFTNIKKRQVKSPKVYIKDSGILHFLLGTITEKDINSHPKCGASFEGFALEQILSWYPNIDAYFWATHSQAELDLMLVHGQNKWGFEFKYTDSPKSTRSIAMAMQALKLKHLSIIIPGEMEYKIKQNISVVGISSLKSHLLKLKIPHMQ